MAIKPSRKPTWVQKHISNYLKYIENIKSASPHTLRAYQKDLEQAFTDYEGQESGLLDQARQSLNKWGKLGAATKNRKIATLKSFFNYLYEHQLTPTPLAGQIRSPKVPKKIPHFISVDEALALLKSFRPGQEHQRLLFLLLYGIGLRVSEACSLQWKNIHLGQKTLKVRGKGQKERILAMPSILVEELQTMKVEKIGDFVFGEKPLPSRKAYTWMQQAGAQAGLLKPLHPHALRHSFATHILSSGANLRTLQELLGHESLTATQKYTHLGVDQLARTMSQHHPLSQRNRSK